MGFPSSLNPKPKNPERVGDILRRIYPGLFDEVLLKGAPVRPDLIPGAPKDTLPGERAPFSMGERTNGEPTS
jgi:hypothetical protein